MGLIKAIGSAIGGSLADQWLEILEPNDMGDNTVFTSGVTVRKESAMNQMSVDGIRISHVASKGRELSEYMANILDEDWKKTRGMEIQAVGISSISYDDESKDLINMRNKGAMLGDASVREGYVQGSIARGKVYSLKQKY